MKNPSSLPPRLRRAVALLALPVLTSSAAWAQFNQVGAGPYDYDNTANWIGGTINNTFSNTPTANQVVYFDTDLALSSNWSISNTTTFSRTFRGEGGARSITIGGGSTSGISLGGSATNANTVTLGSTNANEALNLVFAANRQITVGTNRTLDILNVVSGTGTITTSGAGTIRFSNEANTFSNFLQVGVSTGGGVVEVTKLADTGVASSIGTGNEVRFGGSPGSTLRYIGSTASSTNRILRLGGSGAILDASGGGAMKWTGTSNLLYSGGSNTATQMTLAGTSTHDNTLERSIVNNGTGVVSLNKNGTGRWIVSGNNTFTGDITINAGTLELGSNTAGGNSANVVLNGGTLATGGFDETFGTLDVNGNAIIDMGSGTSALVFLDSSGVTWDPSVSLTIVNFDFGTDSIRFGTSSSGLTLAQLGQITIVGFESVGIDSDGYLTAIPEPSTYAFLAGAGGLLIAGSRRRVRAQ